MRNATARDTSVHDATGLDATVPDACVTRRLGLQLAKLARFLLLVVV